MTVVVAIMRVWISGNRNAVMWELMLINFYLLHLYDLAFSALTLLVGCHGVSLGRFWEYNNFHLCIGL